MRSIPWVFMLLAACVVGEDDFDTTTSVEQYGQSTQGQSTQGQSTQGQSTQGQSTQGAGVEAVRATSVTLNGFALADVKVEKGELRARSKPVPGKRVAHYAGAALVGAAMTGTRGDNSPVLLRIEAYATDTSTTLISAAYPGHQSNNDVHLYKVSYLQGTTWRPLCNKRYETDANGNRYEASDSEMAVLLPGVWLTLNGDYVPSNDQFTIGCWEGTIAKCVRWGYKPWKLMTTTSGTTVDLKDLHLACVRGAMADYCGTNTSHTVDGTKVDVFDRYGFIEKVHEWFNVEGFSEESSFSAKGAGCVEKERWASIDESCPDKEEWIEPNHGPGGWRHPFKLVLPPFSRGERAQCVTDTSQLVMFDTSTYCATPFSWHRRALAKDCSACTQAVCSARPSCCDVNWSHECVNLAKSSLACGGPLNVPGPILTL